MPLARHYYKEFRYEHFRTFCAVARQGTYSAAGGSLGLSRSTVWQQVESLEREFSVKLTRRHGRGRELTAEGRQVAGYWSRRSALGPSRRQSVARSDRQGAAATDQLPGAFF